MAPPGRRPVLSTIVFDVAYRDPTWLALERTPEGARVAFQPVPEGKATKNRVHVDPEGNEFCFVTAED